MSPMSGMRYCATEKMSNIDWEQFMTFMMEERRAQREDDGSCGRERKRLSRNVRAWNCKGH